MTTQLPDKRKRQLWDFTRNKPLLWSIWYGRWAKLMSFQNLVKFWERIKLATLTVKSTSTQVSLAEMVNTYSTTSLEEIKINPDVRVFINKSLESKNMRKESILSGTTIVMEQEEAHTTNLSIWSSSGLWQWDVNTMPTRWPSFDSSKTHSSWISQSAQLQLITKCWQNLLRGIWNNDKAILWERIHGENLSYL